MEKRFYLRSDASHVTRGVLEAYGGQNQYLSDVDHHSLSDLLEYIIYLEAEEIELAFKEIKEMNPKL